MSEQLKIEINGRKGEVQLFSGDQKAGFMEIEVGGNILKALHTEVFPAFEGQGFGKKLLGAMVDYARKNELKVIPLCPYVHAQFKRRPEEFSDIWLKKELP